jgi:hypothetical protein
MWGIWQGDTAKYKVQDHLRLARLNKVTAKNTCRGGNRGLARLTDNSGLVRA